MSSDLFSVLGPTSVSGSEVVNEGGSVSLHCKVASAHPEPTVTWSKLNANDFAVSVAVSSWLNISNITRDEAGDYICIANNICGKRKSSRRAIDVQCKGKYITYSEALYKAVSKCAIITLDMELSFNFG